MVCIRECGRAMIPRHEGAGTGTGEGMRHDIGALKGVLKAMRDVFDATNAVRLSSKRTPRGST